MGDLDKERLQCNKGNEGKIWVRRVERVGEERGGDDGVFVPGFMLTRTAG